MSMNDRQPVDFDNSLIFTVGERIRHFRALRGISRKILAARANVSERHLAQVESGSGNVSIRLLGQIADGLGIAAQELLADRADNISLNNALAKLSVEKRQHVLNFALSLTKVAVRPINIIGLIGLRGAGKSTLGRQLAAQKRVPFVRITSVIETLAGMAIAEIHSLSGQAGYRRYEFQAIENALTRKDGCVIEAGGSLVANSAAFQALLQGSFVVWVQASPEDHMERVIKQGDLRPIEGRSDAMDDLEQILKERETYYSQAHAQINTTRTEISSSLRELTHITDSIWSASP